MILGIVIRIQSSIDFLYETSPVLCILFSKVKTSDTLEVICMDKTNFNHSIKCSVTQCTNHATGGDYCALSQIKVGTHESNPTNIKCTDCESFATS